MDSATKLHVVYSWLDNSSGTNNRYLMYTDNTEGAWSTPTVVDNASINFFGSGHSIAVDSQGRTYITYTNSVGVKVATNAGGSWANTTIDSANVYSNPSIAVDHNDNVHISYFRYPTGLGIYETYVVHATNAGGTWTNETVANLPLGNVALGTAIAIDSSNHAIIAFVNYSAISGSLSGNVTIASNAAGSWQTTLLDTSGAALGAIALTVDHNDNDHVLYMTSTNLTDQLNGTLKYATNSGGTWTSQNVIDLIGYAYLYGAHVVVDTRNNPTICYVNVTLGDTSNTTNVTYFQTNILTLNAGSWSVAAIPFSLFPSMAIDSNNNLYVVYLGYSTLNQSNGSGLNYATAALATRDTVPSQPTNFGVSAGNAQVALTWSAPSSEGGQTISGYRIYRGSSASSTTEISSVDATTFTYLDTSVTNGVDYYYNVAAVNSLGAGTATTSLMARPSASISNDSVPGPVTNVSVQTDDGKVTLNWNSPTTGGPVDHVLIYRSTSNVRPSNPIGNVSGTTAQYVDTNVSNGVDYYYWIVPVNPIGNGSAISSGAVTPNVKTTDYSLMIAIIVIVVILMIAAWFIIRRGRKK